MTQNDTPRKFALLAVVCMFMALSAQAQVVSFIDPKFKAALVENPDINTNGDGEIQVSEAEAYSGMINVAGKDISDLTGIEAFVMLSDLRVHYNNLTHLDVSANTSLEKLHIQNNQISNVDLGANTELEMLRAQNNNLTELVLTENNSLRYLEAQNNNLTVLNIKNGNNTSIYAFNASGNPDLECVQVDDAAYASSNWGDDVDAGTGFSTECDYGTEEVVHIPDQNFKDALLADENINTNGDDEIQVSETEGITEIDASGAGVSDATGVKAFEQLLQLNLNNNNLSSLDVSWIGLDYLTVSNNQLNSLTLGNAIAYIEADNNPDLTCIQTNGESYYRNNSSWGSVDEGVVFRLNCYYDDPIINIPDPNFKSAMVAAHDINADGEIQTPGETQYVYSINVSGRGISDLTGVEEFGLIEWLDCSDNSLTSLDISSLQNLSGVECSNNQIQALAIHPYLSHMNIANNSLSSLTLPGEDGSGNFIELDISNNSLISLDISSSDYTLNLFDASGNPDLTCVEVEDPATAEAQWSDNVDEGVTFSTDCEGSSGGDVVYIPDQNFKNALLADANINYNGDDEIQTEEAMNAEQVLVSGENIYDLTGIEHFINIERLVCSNNNLISLDISKNRNLNFFDCSNNDLTFLNMKTGGFLELYDFDATGNPDLQCVQVDNQFAWNQDYGSSVDPGVVFRNQCFQDEVDIVLFYDETFKNLMLDNAGINTNDDHEIQVVEATNFTGTIDISNMGINNVRGIETFSSIAGFVGDNNNLTALDLSQNTALQTVSVANNELQFLSIKNGNSEAITHFDATGNEDLECIEVDDPSGWSGGADEGATFSSDCGPMNVNMPDRLFLDRAVRNAGLDTNSDGLVQTHEAASFNGTLDITGLDHSDENYEFHVDLTGLEVFGELTGFVAYFVGLDTLDVSSLSKLNHLDVHAANLEKLNVQNGNNENFTHFNALYNTFSCVEVDDVAYAEANWTGGVDDGVEFSTDCEGSSGGDIVYIPDQNFKDALLADEDINTNGDDEIQVSEAETYAGQINVAGQDIEDLTGIEAFTMLTDLRVHYNNLSTLDLSSNTALEKLHFQNNELSSINLSTNPELEMIRAQNNNLMSLDLSSNSNLRYLEVQNNALSELNIKNGNNTSMYSFNATGNPGLSCIQVDDESYAEANWADNVDSGASFSTDCGYSSGEVVYIPDQNFKDALLADEDINTNGDDEIQLSETDGVTEINARNASIADLTGVEEFTGLTQLIVDGNDLTSLDVSVMGLDYLNVSNNELTSLHLGAIVEYLDAAGNSSLSCIQTSEPGYYEDNPNVSVDEGVEFSNDCSSSGPEVVYIPDQNFKDALLADENINTNGDDEIQLSETEGVTVIDASGNNIADLTGVEEFDELLQLIVHNNDLSSLDISGMGLDYLGANDNQLTSLNLGGIVEYLDATNNDLSCIQTTDPGYYEGNPNVEVDEGVTFSTDCSAEPVVYIPDENFKAVLLASDINSNGDDEIQYSETKGIPYIYVDDQNISDLTGIEAFTDMELLECSGNNLTSLDLSNNTALMILDCSDNAITHLDLTANTVLNELTASNNALEELLLPNSVLQYINADHNNLSAIDVTPVIGLEILDLTDNEFETLDVSSTGALLGLYVGNNNLTMLNVQNGNNINMYDFYATGNPLGCVQVDDVSNAEAYWSNNVDPGAYFSLDCSSGGPMVVHIPDANFKNALLVNEDINTNGDNEIQVSEAEAFTGQINVAGQGISDLTGVEAFTALTDLRVHYNNLTTFDVSANSALEKLHFQNNKVASVDLSANTRLEMIRAQNNELEYLDLSANTGLRYLEVQYNELTGLNIRNGNNTAIYSFNAVGNPGLGCIQVDDVAYAETNWSGNVDAGASFSTDCSGAMARTAQTDNGQLLAEGETFDDVIVYPVPTENELTVRTGPLAENTELLLFDTEGRQFYRELMPAGGNADVTVDLRQMNLSSGVYYIRLVNGENTMTKKFIKK